MSVRRESERGWRLIPLAVLNTVCARLELRMEKTHSLSGRRDGELAFSLTPTSRLAKHEIRAPRQDEGDISRLNLSNSSASYLETRVK